MALTEERLRKVAVRVLKEMADGVPDQPEAFEELKEGRLSVFSLKGRKVELDHPNEIITYFAIFATSEEPGAIDALDKKLRNMASQSSLNPSF